MRTETNPTRRWLLAIATAAAIAIVLLEPLIASWRMVDTSASTLGGLLPWSDASVWLHGTHQLLNHGELDDWTIRRPLHPVFLSPLVAAAGSDLQGILILRTLLLAVGAFVFTRELSRSFGVLPAAAGFAVIAFAARSFSPLLLSEAPALTVALGGAALLWRGARDDRLASYALGVALLATALFIRPGALLALPLLALWPLSRAAAPLRNRLRWSAWASAGVLAAFLLSSAWSNAIYHGDNKPGANFAYTFYGLAHGGASYHLFYDRFNHLRLPESEAVALAYSEAFEHIRKRPIELAWGVSAFMKNYFRYHAVLMPPGLPRSLYRVLFWLGVAALVWFRHRPEASLLLAVQVAAMGTAPLIFWSADAARAYMATAPFDAAAVAFAVAAITQLLRHRALRFPARDRLPDRGRLVYAYAAAIGAMVTVLPAAAIALHQPAASESPGVCDDGSRAMVLNVGGESPYLRIVDDTDMAATFAPDVRLSDFRADQTTKTSDIRDVLLTLEPGARLVHGHNLAARQPFATWVVIQDHQLEHGDGLYQVCGDVLPASRGHEVIVATAVHPLGQAPADGKPQFADAP